MDLKDHIDNLLTNGYNPIRKFPSFRFGNYYDCKYLLMNTMNKMDKTVSKFELLPEYEQIIKWMMDTKGKGLGMIGHSGRGKTTILQSVLPTLFLDNFNLVFHPIACENLANEPFYYNRKMFALDDIGVESIANNYGNVYEPFSKAVNICESESKLLFFTTNLNDQLLKERYGIRIYDRIIRLTEIVPFNGKSYRK